MNGNKAGQTEPAEAVLAELIRREPLFHRPEFGVTRADFERMTADEFWETGASGQQYSRTFVLDELEKRFATQHPASSHAPSHKDQWETSDFRCQPLAENLYLLTYTLLQEGIRRTRRMTIWRQTADGWKAVYHQGTVIAAPNPSASLK